MAKKAKEGYLYAFDLSMACSGLVIFDIATCKHVLITSYKTNDKQEHGERLTQLRQHWSEIMEKYPPTEVSIERGFSRFNTSTQVIYRVHGVCNELFNGFPQKYYPPKTVKEAIVSGNATKKQLQDKIKLMYPDVEFANEDESDAFAVGLTHLIKTKRIKFK